MSDLKMLFQDLVRFEIALWNAVDARLLADCDLPLTWYEPMQVIAATPGCRVFDIAEGLSITMGGTSKLVDRIEASGLCRRRPNPDDGRSSIIELTPAGRRRLGGATEALEEELDARIGSLLPPETLDRLGATLRRLRAGRQQGVASDGAPELAS